MIYECISFNDELDLLDLRLHELDGLVDKFVLVESMFTLTGKPKPLYYKDNIDRFSDYQDKIIHVIIDKPEPKNYAYTNLILRKEHYTQALQNCKPNDIIVATDPDIIFKKKALETIESFNLDNMEVIPYCDWYCYYMDYFFPKFLFGFSGVNLYKNIIPGQWSTIQRWKPVGGEIHNAGYHFSKLGSVEDLLRNVESYPHQEFNNSQVNNRDNMLYRRENGYSWHDTEYKEVVMQLIPYKAENYPDYVNKNPQIFSKYFKGGMGDIQSR